MEINIITEFLIMNLSDGSAEMSIANPRALMVPQKAGKPFKIRCDLDLVNVSFHFEQISTKMTILQYIP